LISPSIESKGQEFADLSISLSARYQQALMNACGIPLTLPATVSREVISESVNRCDGVLLTGGEDVDRELVLIDEVFQQRKPLLAICRGHQILHVALGGSLIVDIPSQKQPAINHRRMDKRSDLVHEVRLTADSLLAK